VWNAGLDFTVSALGGIGVGLGIAFGIYAIHRFLPTTPSIDTAIMLITPYLMYIISERFEVSGILAVVSGGLFLSARSTEIFTYETRIQSYGAWETLVYLLNGTVFILIGLQLPVILQHIPQGSLPTMILHGIVISLVTILVRIIWVYPATYLPRLISRKIKESEPNPGWKSVFIVAWSGMRGVVSLAAALSIPLTLSAGENFPFRNEILLITFIVILMTLVFQGLTLPWLITKFNIVVKDDSVEQELEIQMHLANAMLVHLDEHYSHEVATDKAFQMLKERNEHFRTLQQKQLKKRIPASVVNIKYFEALLDLIEVRRRALVELKDQDKYPDELIKNVEKSLDHEEARLRVHVKPEQ